MIFDTHTHYNDERYDEDRDAVLASLPQGGIGAVINCGDSIEGSRASVRLCTQYPFMYAAVGVHPENVGDMTENDIEALLGLAQHQKVVAIGEIGLDYHYEDAPARETQMHWFKRQIELARKLSLPFIVHERDACADTLAVLREVGYANGVMHCFSGSVETARIVLDLGMYIAFGGTVTYKNNRKTKEVAAMVPPDRYLIETDCPYLPPDGHRGERNVSLYLPRVIDELAVLRGTDAKTVEEQTTENAERLFHVVTQTL